MAQREQILPHFSFAPDTAEEIIDAARALEKEAYSDPERCAAAANVLALGTSAVKATLGFLESYPEGTESLRVMIEFLDLRADREAIVDKDLDNAIMASVAKMPEDPRLTLTERTLARRCRWLAEFVRRMAA